LTTGVDIEDSQSGIHTWESNKQLITTLF